MKFLGKALIVCLLASTAASPVQAQAPRNPPVASTAEPKVRPAALRLATILSGHIDPERQVDQLLATTLKNDPNWIKLEAQYPGIGVVVAQAMKPEMLAVNTQTNSAYIADVAQLFSDELTDAELDELSTFWSGPIGTKLARSANDNVDFSASSQEIVSAVKDGKEATVSQRATQGDVRRASLKSIVALNKDEYAILAKFTARPAARKFANIGPQKQAIENKWFNYSTPEIEARLEKVVMDAVVDYISKQENKK